MDAPAALNAFAAFLRFSLEHGPSVRLSDLGRFDLNLNAIQSKLRGLVAAGVEGGSRGEAVVAAALDLVFSEVIVNVKKNDPSRHWPGDVVVLRVGGDLDRPDGLLLTVEVKERSASAGEIYQFARNLADAGLRRGLYALLDPNQEALDAESISSEIWQRSGTDLHILHGIDAIVGGALTWTSLSVEEAVTTLVRQVAHRLEEKQARLGLQEWVEFVEQLPHTAEP